MKKVTKEELTNDIIRVINETNDCSLKAYKTHGKYCQDLLYRNFGHGWRKTLIELGYVAHNGDLVKKSDLVEDITNVIASTGNSKQENYIQHGKYSRAVINRIFGSWNKALRSLGYKVNMLKPGQYTEKDVIDAYYKMKTELGYSPSAVEFRTQSGYSQSVIIRLFGNYSNMLKQINEPVKDGSVWTNEELEQIARDLYAQYHIFTYYFTIKLFPVSNVTLINRYGSIKNFCDIAQVPLSSDKDLTNMCYARIKQLISHELEYEKTWDWFINSGNNHYRVDIFCSAINLAIEIDGADHIGTQKTIDTEKDTLLHDHGINILRIELLDINNITSILNSLNVL